MQEREGAISVGVRERLTDGDGLLGCDPLAGASWRRDGADLPQGQRIMETYDFEFEPGQAGELHLEVFRSRGRLRDGDASGCAVTLGLTVRWQTSLPRSVANERPECIGLKLCRVCVSDFACPCERPLKAARQPFQLTEKRLSQGAYS